MILDLQHIDPQRIAAIDSSGAELRYAEISQLSLHITSLVPTRSLCFLLVENNVGGIAWVMSMLDSRQLVPLILNVKTEDTLYQQLINTYQPTYICAPNHSAVQGEVVDCQYDYTLTKISDTTRTA